MKWNELTDAEIDVMDGPELDFHVADALGWGPYRYDRHHGGQVMARHSDSNVMRQWHPHTDANQAREVWAAMAAIDDHVELTMACDDVVIDTSSYGQVTILAEGDFCAAICRAYLKARLDSDRWPAGCTRGI